MQAKGPLISLAFLRSESALAPRPKIRKFRRFAIRLRSPKAWGRKFPGSDPTQGWSTVLVQSHGGLERTPRLYLEGLHAIL